jgi:hypothetical protein
MQADEPADPAAETEYLVMNGSLVSQVCGVALELNVSSTKVEVYYSKAVNYTLMITTLTFIQASCSPFPLPGFRGSDDYQELIYMQAAGEIVPSHNLPQKE